MIDLQILADTDAYHTLEDNLKNMGFERAENEKQQKLSWRWQTRTEHGALMVLELLADAPDVAGGRVQALPTEGTISALNIPHSAIFFDLHQIAEIQAELLGKFDEELKTAFDFDYWLRAFARFSGRIGFVDAVQQQRSSRTPAL